MRPKSGSLRWLLVHDLRIAWRRFADLFGRLTSGGTWVVCAVGVIALHLLAWPAMIWLTHLQQDDAGINSSIAILSFSVFAWMVAQGLLGTARTLQERGTLDLLLASPLPARLVLASRAMATAANSFGSAAILVLPAANVAAYLRGPAWLGAYPALLALALIGTSGGLAVAIGLFLALSPRRARLVSQLCAAVIGAAFLLTMQIAAMLPAATRSAITDHVASWVAGTLFDPAALVRLPVAAFRGEPWAMLSLTGFSLALLAATVVLLSNSFVRAGLRAAGAPADAGTGRPDQGTQHLQFGSSLGQTLRRKEWRLLWRDHNVFAQLSLQIVYTLPLVVVLLRGVDNIPLVIALAPAIVVISAQIAASLAWITVSGEDAPELIAAAPVHRAEVELAKVTAVAVPVAAIVVFPFAGLAVLSPYVALLAALFAAAASISTVLLNLWHPMPGNRRGMLRRHSQSKIMALLEHLMALLWAIAIVFAVVGTAWLLLPIGLAVGLLAYLSPARRTLTLKRARPIPSPSST
jgi:ABC-2 type transport system permease protein